MSVAPDSTETRIRISDPRPSHCAACFRGPEEGVVFVDFDAAIDRGTFLTEERAVLDSIDDLHLCESCVKQGAEVLNFRPGLHNRQLREIRRLETAVEHWRGYAKRLEATLEERPERAPSARKPARGATN